MVPVSSLTSSASICPGTRSSRNSRATTAGNAGLATQACPMLTDTGTTHPAAAHARCCASACRSISRDSSSISPSSSLSGMNNAGCSTPSSGCSHRASSSAATSRPDDSSTSGWKYPTTCPPRSAPGNSARNRAATSPHSAPISSPQPP